MDNYFFDFLGKMKELLIQSLTKFVVGVFAVGSLLFIPAWSLHFWNGWLLMGILFIPIIILGILLFIKDPELLRKRLNGKEQQQEQKSVVAFSALLFVIAFVVAGINWRLQLLVLPDWIAWIAACVFLASYVMYAEVLRENTFLSRTVEVQENQKVIDTGLYGIVRHPMYMATTVMFMVMPLVLGSPVSFLVMLLYIPLIIKRIRNEELVLSQGLEGYDDYKKRVKYRIMPFIW